MWRRPLSSAILVAATHRRLRKASNGTSTQVVACIINKWRAKISEKMLYNVRDLPGTRGGGLAKNLKNTVIPRTEIVIKFK